MRILSLMLVLFVTSGFGAINKYWHVAADGTGDRTEGTSWVNGVAINMDTLDVATLTAGDVVFIKDGLYTLGNAIDWSAMDGAATAPIALVGVKAATTNVGLNVTYSDLSIDTIDSEWLVDTVDAPTLALVTYQFKVGDYYVLNGLRFHGDALNLVSTGTVCNVKYCIFNETAASSSTRKALVTGTYNNVTACAFYSANAGGLSVTTGCKVSRCLFYNFPDATNGIAILVGGNSASVSLCIFKNVAATAVSIGSTDYGTYSQNTFFKCATDYSTTDGFGNTFENNLHDSTSVDAYKLTTQTDINTYWNNFCGNGVVDCYDGVDSSTVFMDYRVKSGNPGFNSATDFSLSPSSKAKNVGAGVRTVLP